MLPKPKGKHIEKTQNKTPQTLLITLGGRVHDRTPPPQHFMTIRAARSTKSNPLSVENQAHNNYPNTITQKMCLHLANRS